MSTETKQKTVSANGTKAAANLNAPIQSTTSLNQAQLYAIMIDYLATRHKSPQRVTKLTMTREGGLTIEHEDS